MINANTMVREALTQLGGTGQALRALHAELHDAITGQTVETHRGAVATHVASLSQRIALAALAVRGAAERLMFLTEAEDAAKRSSIEEVEREALGDAALFLQDVSENPAQPPAADKWAIEAFQEMWRLHWHDTLSVDRAQAWTIYIAAFEQALASRGRS